MGWLYYVGIEGLSSRKRFLISVFTTSNLKAQTCAAVLTIFKVKAQSLTGSAACSRVTRRNKKKHICNDDYNLFVDHVTIPCLFYSCNPHPLRMRRLTSINSDKLYIGKVPFGDLYQYLGEILKKIPVGFFFFSVCGDLTPSKNTETTKTRKMQPLTSFRLPKQGK